MSTRYAETAAAPRPIELNAGEHLFTCGMTGAGKTTTIKRLLTAVPRYVVLDAKHKYGAPRIPTYETFRRDVPRQVIRMPRGANNYQAWGAQIDRIYADGNRVIYIDECTGLTGSHALPDSYDWAIRTGREHNVAVWSGTQTPVHLPGQLFSQSTHFLIFFLSSEREKIKILNETNWVLEPAVRALKLHDFVYYNKDEPDDWRFYQGDKWPDGESPEIEERRLQ